MEEDAASTETIRGGGAVDSQTVSPLERSASLSTADESMARGDAAENPLRL